MLSWREFLNNHSFEIPNTLTLSAAFRDEMKSGLAGSGSLAMLRSGIRAGKLHKGKAAVIDAGGTRLRVALVEITDEPRVLSMKTYPMPGSSASIKVDEFFEQLAELSKQEISGADCVGLCFSYPCESVGADGRVLRMAKEVEIDGIEGRLVCDGLKNALAEKDIAVNKRFVLLNDSVAVLLCAALDKTQRAFDIGLIVGTGTNVCCMLNIAGEQAINLESGSFDKLKRTDIDLEFDSGLADVGKAVLEKQVSGRYLGALVLKALKTAAHEDVFSRKFAQMLLGYDSLPSEKLDELVGLSLFAVCDDAEAAAAIADAFVKRAAAVTVSQLVGTVLFRSVETTKNRPALCIAEGSVISLCQVFRNHFERMIKALEDDDIYIRVISVPDAVTLGSACAALMEE